MLLTSTDDCCCHKQQELLFTALNSDHQTLNVGGLISRPCGLKKLQPSCHRVQFALLRIKHCDMLAHWARFEGKGAVEHNRVVGTVTAYCLRTTLVCAHKQGFKTYSCSCWHISKDSPISVPTLPWDASEQLLSDYSQSFFSVMTCTHITFYHSN